VPWNAYRPSHSAETRATRRAAADVDGDPGDGRRKKRDTPTPDLEVGTEEANGQIRMTMRLEKQPRAVAVVWIQPYRDLAFPGGACSAT